ncbi:MAG: peptidoglycan bridge formation glycyltransferase FemA/FemB family protein [Patescibacteria group bacterium]
MDSQKQNYLNCLVQKLNQIVEKENCAFIRISPLMLKTAENEKIFKDLEFRKAPIHMHAELVWMLDLMPTEEELLKNMRKNTRYYIRKAMSEGVKIIKSNNPEDVKIFKNLYEQTAERHHFVPFSEDYLKKEFESFIGDNQVMLFFAEYKNEIISAAMIIFFGGSVFYHHGASSLKYPRSSASYLLQWEAIKEAKNRGCRFYNFWGIAPENNPKHPWAGLTLFKKGFGGFSEEYIPAHDFVIKYSYWFVCLIEKIRKIRRGL